MNSETDAAGREKGTPREITESLYKRSVEINAKNKVLSLLGKLYETSARALEPTELAAAMSAIIQENQAFEFVGVFTCDQATDELTLIGSASSERFSQFESSIGMFIFDNTLSGTKNHFVREVITTRKGGYTEEIREIVGDTISDGRIQTESHIKLLILYPLVSDDRVIGMLLLCLNREYAQLLDHEKELIITIVNVMAVALDKALLYQQLRKSNLLLAESNARLKELDRQKTEFVSIASHQLRSPLTAMTGYASLLLDGDLGELSADSRDAVLKIFESGKSMAVAIDDFLNVTRIEQGRLEYNYSEFPLHSVVKQAIAEMAIIAERKNIRLGFESDAHAVTLYADEGKIKQVITNLIDNAIKYTPSGSVAVSIEHNEGAHTIAVHIEDTGIGLSEEDIHKLFGKFSRAENANHVSVRGTGLGLFIAREMARAHGGDILVNSEGRGKGSTFTLTLPERAQSPERMNDAKKGTILQDDNESIALNL